jgi:hypothetical protein
MTLEAAWFDEDFLSDDRIGYRAEWSNALDRFSAVAAAYAGQTHDPEVTAELIDVARLIVAFAPSLDRMQLRRPSPDDLRRLGILSAA